ncbi:hypothetical protein B2G74_10770 [Burkholderia sp. A27]|nr:hypothetical protein B2G74_10770 [Burkholderia sp. A27]
MQYRERHNGAQVGKTRHEYAFVAYSRPEPSSGRGEIGGTRERVPNASTRYADTLTGLKLHFAAVACHAT